MNTNNVSHISTVQRDFSNLAEINHDQPCVSSTPASHVPSPPSMIHPTQPAARVYAVMPKPNSHPQQLHRNPSVDSDGIPPETVAIFDYMIWSQINIVLGGIVLGIPAFLLSVKTRKFKQEGNVARAKILSSITLGVNIFVTVVFMSAMVFLITYYHGVN